MTRASADEAGMSSSSDANGSGAGPAAAAVGQMEGDHSPTAPVVGASSTNGNDAIAGNNATRIPSTSGAPKDAVAEGGIMNEEGGNDAESSPDATQTTGNGKKQ